MNKNKELCYCGNIGMLRCIKCGNMFCHKCVTETDDGIICDKCFLLNEEDILNYD